MTFSHLFSSALDYELGTDDSTRLFTTARRKNAVNEGIEQFAALTECFTRQSTLVSSHGVAEYNLLSTVNIPGADYIRPSQQKPEYQLTSSGATATITYITGDNFERRDVDWLNTYAVGWRESTGGTPQFWYERSDGGRRYFGMYPPPEITSSQSGKVIFGYIAKPPTLTSDTDMPFSVASTAIGQSTGIRTDLEIYHQGVVHYAAHKLEKLRLHTEESQGQLQMFLGWVQRYVSDKRPKGGQTVRTARNYFADARRRYRGTDLPKPQTGWNYGG